MTLKLLPLTYDREIKDLVFFYKTLYGHIDLKILMNSYVSFIEHRRTRLNQVASVVLQIPLCRTTTFQSSYFNHGTVYVKTFIQIHSPVRSPLKTILNVNIPNLLSQSKMLSYLVRGHWYGTVLPIRNSFVFVHLSVSVCNLFLSIM